MSQLARRMLIAVMAIGFAISAGCSKSPPAGVCGLDTQNWLVGLAENRDGRPHLRIKIDDETATIMNRRVPIGEFDTAISQLAKLEPPPILDVQFSEDTGCRGKEEIVEKLNKRYGCSTHKSCGIST